MRSNRRYICDGCKRLPEPLNLSKCKACRSIADKDYRKKNWQRISEQKKRCVMLKPELYKKISRSYYLKYKAEFKRAGKLYYQKNKAKLSIQYKEYRLKNKDKIALKGKIYRLKNRAKILKAQKLRRLENPEKCSAAKKNSYLKNKAHYLKKAHEYRLKNPARIAAMKKRWMEKNLEHYRNHKLENYLEKYYGSKELGRSIYKVNQLTRRLNADLKEKRE